MARFKIIVIGAGRIASIHARSVARSQTLALAAIVDPLGGGELPGRLSAPCFATLDEAVERVRPDGLIVASPTATHVEYIDRACELGLPVFCEKPLSFDRQATVEAIARVEAAGIPALLGFHRRHDPARMEMRRRMLDGEVGRVEHILMFSRDPVPAAGPTRGHLGSIVADMMIHDLDELVHLIGRLPDTAHSVIQQRPATRDGEGDVESADVLLNWHDGPVAHVSATRRAVHAFEQKFEIFGSHGRLICTDPLVSPVVFDGPDDSRTARRHRQFWERYQSAYEAEVEHFAGILAGREQPLCSFSDGLRAHDLAEMVTSVGETDRLRRS